MNKHNARICGTQDCQDARGSFDTCEDKAEEFGNEDLEFGQEEDADFKEFEDFSRRRSARFKRIRRLCQL
jgi:hypothetical protein